MAMYKKRITAITLVLLFFSVAFIKPVQAEASIFNKITTPYKNWVDKKAQESDAKRGNNVTLNNAQKRMQQELEIGQKTLKDNPITSDRKTFTGRFFEKSSKYINNVKTVTKETNKLNKPASELRKDNMEDLIGWGVPDKINRIVRPKPFSSTMPQGYKEANDAFRLYKPEKAQNLFTSDVMSNFTQMSAATARQFGGKVGSQKTFKLTLDNTLDKNAAFQDFKSGLNIDNNSPEVVKTAFKNFESMIAK